MNETIRTFESGPTMPAFVKAMACGALLLVSQISIGQNLELNGIGQFSEFGQPSMVVRIDSVSFLTDEEQAQESITTDRLSFRIVLPKTERSWGQHWRQTLSLNNTAETLTGHIDNLLTISDVLQGPLDSGDLVTFDLLTQDVVSMQINNIEITRLGNRDFYEFLLTAYTGPVPQSGLLKEQLLGLSTSKFEDDLALFESVQFDEERQEIVQNWVILPDEPEEVEDPEAIALAEAEAEAEAAAEAERLAALEEEERLRAEEEAARLAAEEEAKRLEEIAKAEEERLAALAELISTQNQVQSIWGQVNQYIEYPASAIRNDREGTVRVSILVNRDGSIASVDLIELSGHTTLDNAALDGINDAAPFEPFPDAIRDDQVVAEFPITFALQE